jgi:hypothetical protein
VPIRAGIASAALTFRFGPKRSFDTRRLSQGGRPASTNEDCHRCRASGKIWIRCRNGGGPRVLRVMARDHPDRRAKGETMPEFSRVELHKSTEIPASADEVWSLLTDWAGMFRWRLTAEQGGAPGPALVKCELIGEPGAVPRTRRMTLGNGAIGEEQLFYQNDETRRIYYSKNATAEVSGYIASAYVDEIDGKSCTLHVSSMSVPRAILQRPSPGLKQSTKRRSSTASGGTLQKTWPDKSPQAGGDGERAARSSHTATPARRFCTTTSSRSLVTRQSVFWGLRMRAMKASPSRIRGAIVGPIWSAP